MRPAHVQSQPMSPAKMVTWPGVLVAHRVPGHVGIMRGVVRDLFKESNDGLDRWTERWVVVPTPFDHTPDFI